MQEYQILRYGTDAVILICDTVIFAQYVILAYWFRADGTPFSLGMRRAGWLASVAFFIRMIFDVVFLIEVAPIWMTEPRIIRIFPWVILLAIGVIIERRALTGK